MKEIGHTGIPCRLKKRQANGSQMFAMLIEEVQCTKGPFLEAHTTRGGQQRSSLRATMHAVLPIARKCSMRFREVDGPILMFIEEEYAAMPSTSVDRKRW